ncbi:hypothetical protein EON65_35365 [archaeon]|nr:MAG: hypothetical protein EON65_35365 [archaeon]
MTTQSKRLPPPYSQPYLHPSSPSLSPSSPPLAPSSLSPPYLYSSSPSFPPCTSSAVNSVAFHPEGSCVASGSSDCSIKMWDARSHLLVQHYAAHDQPVTSISMHPVSRHTYTCSRTI